MQVLIVGTGTYVNVYIQRDRNSRKYLKKKTKPEVRTHTHWQAQKELEKTKGNVKSLKNKEERSKKQKKEKMLKKTRNKLCYRQSNRHHLCINKTKRNNKY